ncbi:MAG: ribonuclease Z [Bacteroidales bacterium]|nr:ribonuclease Z [Bacteroidales bacterium]
MNFHIVVLGTGSATPRLGRHCSAQVVKMNGLRALVDCGEGTQNQISAFHQKLQAIGHIFISHLHGDHILGLPGMLSSMHLGGRTEPVTIYSVPGLKEAIMPLLEYSDTHLDYELNFVEIRLEGNESQEIFSDRHGRVLAFPLSHKVPCVGFRFDERVGNPNHRSVSYAYCCDTVYDEAILPHIQGVDLLCVESTYDDACAPLAAMRYHCTARQAATLAQKANAKSLMLTHFSARYHDVEPLLQQAREVFPHTFEAVDGLHVDVDQWLKSLQP